MGVIAEYTRPRDFDGLVAAVRAFVLVDLGLGIEADYSVEGEGCPHHRLSVDGCRAGIEIVDDAGTVKVVTGDEYELMDVVRGYQGGPPLMTAGEAVAILLAVKGVARG